MKRRDPTYGRIDRDIQEAVDEWGPKNLGQRVAVENTMQARRDERREPPTDVVVHVPGLLRKADPVGPPLAVVFAALVAAGALGYALGRWLG